jgi:chromosome segregation ATPase
VSRAIKVPEALYNELCAEADREGISVMEALQRRLRCGEEELGALRAARQALEKQLREVQAELGQAAATHQTGKAEVAKLRAEVSRLGNAVAAKAGQIAGLEDAVAMERAESSAVRRDRSVAERNAEAQQKTLQAAAVVVGIALAGWLARRWWRQRSAQPAVATQPQQAAPEASQATASAWWQ